jgi:ABC-type transport system substrate-binding protein
MSVLLLEIKSDRRENDENKDLASIAFRHSGDQLWIIWLRSNYQQSNPADVTFTPMTVTAPNCDYGGEIKSVAAVDAYTVKFTLCASDVAFPAKMASLF